MSKTTGSTFSLAILTGLFFAWGFLTCLNDILIPHLRGIFALTYAEAALVQSAFFMAYFISSMPSGAVVGRFGYKNGMIIGLVVTACGAALFFPAASLVNFPLFLFALFVLASGITLLQVAANPYVTLLGSPESASLRLNLTAAFNSLGTAIAPAIGGLLILTTGTATAAEQAATVKGPYLGMALGVFALAGVVSLLRLPSAQEASEKISPAAAISALKSKQLSLGALGIFLYVGAEVAIGSFLVSFIVERVGLTATEAAFYVSFYWGAAMGGRFLGSFLMRYISPAKLLTFAAIGSLTLIVAAILSQGYLSVYALLAVGLCNSIMFPTIFSLGIKGLGAATNVGSSILVMAIVGGAVIPLLTGAGADHFGLTWALILPASCYLFIAYYGATSRS